jgi:hypothetical protein
MARCLAAVAQHEREMIAERTKATLHAAKARGLMLGRNGAEHLAQRIARLQLNAHQSLRPYSPNCGPAVCPHEKWHPNLRLAPFRRRPAVIGSRPSAKLSGGTSAMSGSGHREPKRRVTFRHAESAARAELSELLQRDGACSYGAGVWRHPRASRLSV